MCVVKKPKITAADQEKDKSLPILRNPILDGMLGNIASLRNGTSAFRIDLINPLTIPRGGAGGGATGGGTSGGTSGGGTSGGTSSGSTGGTTGGGGPISYGGPNIPRQSSL